MQRVDEVDADAVARMDSEGVRAFLSGVGDLSASASVDEGLAWSALGLPREALPDAKPDDVQSVLEELVRRAHERDRQVEQLRRGMVALRGALEEVEESSTSRSRRAFRRAEAAETHIKVQMDKTERLHEQLAARERDEGESVRAELARLRAEIKAERAAREALEGRLSTAVLAREDAERRLAKADDVWEEQRRQVAMKAGSAELRAAEVRASAPVRPCACPCPPASPSPPRPRRRLAWSASCSRSCPGPRRWRGAWRSCIQ